MAAFPNTIFTDSVGCSETGFQGMGMPDTENIKAEGAVIDARPRGGRARRRQPVLDPADERRRRRSARRGPAACRWATTRTRRSRARTFLEIDGARYSVPGDFARIEDGNRITLLGRGSNCINTGGEKVYPEEVEMALKTHPGVFDALVVGMPDERFGQRVTAVVQPREDDQPDAGRTSAPPALAAVSGYKIPRSLVAVERDPAQRHRQGQLPEGARPRARRTSRPDRGWRPEMRTDLCDQFGIDYPIFAFTPSEHVAAAVSPGRRARRPRRVRFNEAERARRGADLDGREHRRQAVRRRRRHADEDARRGHVGRPRAMIPQEHKDFVEQTLQKLGVPPLPEGEGREGVLGWLHSMARSHVDVALTHRPVLIANALGSPPVDVIEQAHAHGVKVAALAGAAKHAASHVANGVDIIVAQGYEAGGHTGEIASMVLHPEIVDAVGDVPVLGAGGIGTGRQVAASLALGAQGVWTGLGLAHHRGVPEPQHQQRHDARRSSRATSADTVRARVYTGKPARLLKTRWTEAWEEDAPEPLPMPLQNLLVSDAHNRMNEHGDPDVVSMPVGQIVGRMNEVRPVADVMAELVADFEDAVSRMEKVRG